MSSMSTTDTKIFRKDPPSPLPSDFKVSREQLIGRPHTAADIVADGRIFEDDTHPVDTQLPPNPTMNTPGEQSGIQPALGNENGRLRERSKSNPLGSVPGATQHSDGPSRDLFDADRVEKVGDVAPGSAEGSGEADMQEGSSTIGDTSSSDSTSDTASDATPRLRVLEVRNGSSSEDEEEKISKGTNKNWYLLIQLTYDSVGC